MLCNHRWGPKVFGSIHGRASNIRNCLNCGLVIDESGNTHSLEPDIKQLIRDGKDDYAIQNATGADMNTIRRIRQQEGM